MALQFCVDVSDNGIASVTPSPDDEPLVLVRQSWVKDEEFFTPLEHRPVRLCSAALPCPSFCPKAGGSLSVQSAGWVRASNK